MDGLENLRARAAAYHASLRGDWRNAKLRDEVHLGWGWIKKIMDLALQVPRATEGGHWDTINDLAGKATAVILETGLHPEDVSKIWNRACELAFLNEGEVG